MLHGFPREIWGLVWSWCSPNDLRQFRTVSKAFQQEIDKPMHWNHRLAFYQQKFPQHARDWTLFNYLEYVSKANNTAELISVACIISLPPNFPQCNICTRWFESYSLYGLPTGMLEAWLFVSEKHRLCIRYVPYNESYFGESYFEFLWNRGDDREVYVSRNRNILERDIREYLVDILNSNCDPLNTLIFKNYYIELQEYGNRKK